MRDACLRALLLFSLLELASFRGIQWDDLVEIFTGMTQRIHLRQWLKFKLQK